MSCRLVRLVVISGCEHIFSQTISYLLVVLTNTITGADLSFAQTGDGRISLEEFREIANSKGDLTMEGMD